MRVLISLAALVALPLAGAAGCIDPYGPAAPLVRVHAASDLDCPDKSIVVSEEFSGRFKAVGCGRKAYYRAACDGLSCVVQGEGERSIPWKDRPDPNEPVSPR
jgi:hypothetical protein